MCSKADLLFSIGTIRRKKQRGHQLPMSVEDYQRLLKKFEWSGAEARKINRAFKNVGIKKILGGVL